ncbi:hypothetical protein [Stenotrophomonas sp. 24(2023)]|uniref:hypothetical protein n=1 Tax=Stenotrophomonas sp. 24(2023) TaxID=3068324 RepID=UPI0027E0977E|nr:hypothetical protein [Stenotrophomonas sp. 24(2023)]WMJ67801.1 hypothetical protein Q9R17_11275 [Stenotrophomonas sp. 24(2023)]
MDERRSKYLYAALAAAFGLPSLLLGGAMAVFGIGGGLASLADGNIARPLLMLVWSLAGLAGCLAWLGLSCDYLLGGRRALQARSRAQWGALLLGMIASVPLLGIGIWLGLTYGPRAFALLLAGPSLLLPAAHLAWLRWRQAPAMQG